MTGRRQLSYVLRGAWFLFVFALAAAATVALLLRSEEDVEVPALVGSSAAEAAHALRWKKLSLHVDAQRFSEEVPAGGIVHQSIPAGERVRVGRTVGVEVSRGPRERIAPKVVGLTPGAAQAVLGASGLRSEAVASACADGVPADQISAQQPPPGGAVAGDTLRTVVSSGPCSNRYLMPDLLDRPGDAVVRELAAAGFPPPSIRYETSDELPAGVVLSQEPEEGSVVRPGDLLWMAVSAEAPSEGAAGPDAGRSRLVHIPIRTPPAFFRRSATLRAERGFELGPLALTLLLDAGTVSDVVLWLPEAGEVELEIDGTQIWRKIF